jgi:signal transduction histidine kinase
MERGEALKLLVSKNADDRLRAARFLSRHGVEDDVSALQSALANENNRWAKSAIQKAVSTLRQGSEPEAATIGADGEDERSIEQIYADAVEETTQRLVHEIRPIVGRLDVYASHEIANYAESKTKSEWTRLQELLTAIDRLGQAAAAPIYKEFDLAELLERIIASETHGAASKIEVAGTKPFVMLGAADIIQLVVANAIRNAIEASEGVSPAEPVVVTWGETDRDYWFSVLDRGRGLPSGFTKVFEIGTTTKKGHLGMGLALARQAALTLNGVITLGPREPTGAKFEFRWPHASA